MSPSLNAALCFMLGAICGAVINLVSKSKLEDELTTENDRLKNGLLTPEELQNVCHNLGPEDKQAFFDGCAAHQRKLFGEAQVDKVRATIRRLQAALALKETNTYAESCALTDVLRALKDEENRPSQQS